MKKWYRQKTVWTGVTAIVGGVAGYLTGSLDLVGAFQTVIGGAGMIFLRQGVEKNK